MSIVYRWPERKARGEQLEQALKPMLHWRGWNVEKFGVEARRSAVTGAVCGSSALLLRREFDLLAWRGPATVMIDAKSAMRPDAVRRYVESDAARAGISFVAMNGWSFVFIFNDFTVVNVGDLFSPGTPSPFDVDFITVEKRHLRSVNEVFGMPDLGAVRAREAA